MATSSREGNRRRKADNMQTSQDHTGQNILDYLGDLKNYPNEALAPYEEFSIGGKIYYFTPGGSLYRKGKFISDELWGLSAT
jgi:hypothetical protein